MAEFKANIYPIMIWGLLYGLVASFILLLIFFFSKYITLIWFPIFLIGVIWGGYRNYRKQKNSAGEGAPKSVPQEIKEATQDILSATREMLVEQATGEEIETQAEAENKATKEETVEAEAEAPPRETLGADMPGEAEQRNEQPPKATADRDRGTPGPPPVSR